MRRKKISSTLGKIASRLWSFLPSGGSLPDEVWRRRHRFLVGLTWFHAVIIALLGPILADNWEVSLSAISHEDTVLHAVSEGLLVGAFAFLGGSLRVSRALRAALVGLGLISSSAILVHLLGGYIELHFHFFVMLTFLALYQDWVPFGLSILYVAVHHGVVGVLWPTEVYNHPAAIESPWTWAGIHAFFVLWASVGSVIAWRLNESAIARTKLILDSAGEGIFGVDVDGTVIFVNPAGEKLLGYRNHDLHGRCAHDTFHYARSDGAPYPREECPIYAAFKDGVVHQGGEEVFWRKDGTSFPVDYVSTPIMEGGELRGAVVAFRDVTQRKRAEEETARNLERLRALRDIDHAISSSLDLRTVLAVLMEKIDLVLPYSAVTLRLFDKASGLLEPVACRNLDEAEWQQAQWKGGRGISNVVFESKAPLIIRDTRADARVVDSEFYRRHKLISYVGVPLTVKDEILGVLGFYTKEEHEFTGDEVEFLMTLAGQAAVAIHNSQIYEEMAELAVDLTISNKVKDEFLSVISHELRTPLNVVMGYTALIKDKMYGEVSPEQSRVLDKLMNRMRSQLDMVNSILHATQIQANKVTLYREEVSVTNVLNELRSAVMAALEKPLTLNWDYSSELPVLKIDGRKLKQILENLVDNAIKFTDEGSVTVSARLQEGERREATGDREGGRESFSPHAARLEPVLSNIEGPHAFVEFKVADTGRGIPTQALPIIFEKFRQADSSETRLHGGIGLGLYIAKNFTELLGGAIKVETEPGKGSVFTVTIPCAGSASTVRAEQRTGSQPAARENGVDYPRSPIGVERI
jgi:two-component system sensor histidine kinase/response regulator